MSTLQDTFKQLTPKLVLALVRKDKKRWQLMDSMSFVVPTATDSQQYEIFVAPEKSWGHYLLKTSTTNAQEANAKIVIKENAVSIVYTKDLPKGSRVKLLAPWGSNGILKLSDVFEWDKDGLLTLK